MERRRGPGTGFHEAGQVSRLSAETAIPVRPVEERHAPQNDNDPEERVDVADAGDSAACSECVDEEEGRVPKWRKSPKQPTKKEIEEHEATHIPFRSCKNTFGSC